MLKKIFALLVLATVMVFSNFAEDKAEARDVWVASQGGGNFYVVTETYTKQNSNYFTVAVKIIAPYADDEFNATYWYEFNYSSRGWRYTTEQMGSWESVNNNPVAKRICDYCRNNLY